MTNVNPNLASPHRVPLIGQQQRQAQAAVNQAIQSLSMGIFSHLATNHIATIDRALPNAEVDKLSLEQLARDSITAATAYFTGLGILSIQQNHHDQD